MKYIPHLAIVIGVIILAYLFAPRSCDNVYEYTDTEYRVMKSSMLDSILNVHELKYQEVQDSIILSGAKRDSITRLKINFLQKGYSEQRALIKHLKTIRVDSVGQVINNVPVEEYNALIVAGNKCDSMLNLERGRIAQKDSAFAAMSNKFESEGRLIDSMRDRLEVAEDLNDDYKKQLKKAKKENKLLKYILAAVTLAHLFH